MDTIRSHEEVRTFLNEQGWIEENPSLFVLPILRPRFIVHVFLDTIEENTITLFQRTTNGTLEETYTYKYDADDIALQITACVNRVQKAYEKAKERQKQKRSSASSFDSLLCEKQMTYDKTDACYVYSLSNGMHMYFFLLPNERGIHVTVPLNRERTKYSTQRYAFTQDDNLKLQADVLRHEQWIPFLNTWVSPVTKESETYEEVVESFKSEVTPENQKVKKLRQLMNDYLPEEWLFYLFRPFYNQEDKKGVVEIEFLKRTECSLMNPSLQEMFDSFLESYSFWSLHQKLYSMNVYRIDIDTVTEDDFTLFLQELKEKTTPIISDMMFRTQILHNENRQTRMNRAKREDDNL